MREPPFILQSMNLEHPKQDRPTRYIVNLTSYAQTFAFRYFDSTLGSGSLHGPSLTVNEGQAVRPKITSRYSTYCH